MDVLWTFKFQKESHKLDHVCTKDKLPSYNLPNPSQELPVSSKAPNEDLKDIGVLCTFEIKIESKNLDQRVSKTSDHIQIKMTMSNPSQEPPVSSKAQNEDLKYMDVLCISKIKIESKNLDQR